MLIWPKSLFQICLCSSLLVATYGDAHQSWGLKLVPNVEAGLLLFDGFLVLVELIPNLSWSFNMVNPALVLTSFLGQSVRENKLWLWPLKFGYVNSQRIPIKLQCCWLYFFFPMVHCARGNALPLNPFNSQGQQRLSVSQGCSGIASALLEEWVPWSRLLPRTAVLCCRLCTENVCLPHTSALKCSATRQVHWVLSMVLILGSRRSVVKRCSRIYVVVLSGTHLSWSHCNVLFLQSYQLCKVKLYLSRD